MNQPETGLERAERVSNGVSRYTVPDPFRPFKARFKVVAPLASSKAVSAAALID
jgi:hypothetical protein